MAEVNQPANSAPFYDAIPCAIIAIGADYRIIAFNRVAETLLGINRTAMLGQDLRYFVDEAPLSQILFGQAPAHGSKDMAERINFNFNGHPFQLVFSNKPLLVHDNQITGAVATIEASAKPAKAEQDMRHLEALADIGEMAAVTIHEIRNPLTSISGFVQLLQVRAARQKEQTAEKYCKLITAEIVHINNILSDFLTLAKPREHKLQKLNIVELIKEVFSLLEGEARLAQISLFRHLPKKPLYIIGEADKIKEVLVNICRNAFQSMSAGGTLASTVKTDGEYIRIDLADTGHGMSDATIANIYNPFFTTKETGTGLGLAICRRIVHDHNGKIKVASTLGKGTTFTLLFPHIKDETGINPRPEDEENAPLSTAHSQHLSL